MPFSNDVRLPRDDEPVFPDVCCGCLRERPGETYHVKGRRAALVDLLFFFAPWLRRPVRCAVPTCADCSRRANAQRRRRRLALVACLVAAIPLIAWLGPSRDVARGQRRVVQLGLALVALVPWMLWHAVRPPLFDVTVGKQHVDYEFANARYAEIFRASNPRAASVG